MRDETRIGGIMQVGDLVMITVRSSGGVEVATGDIFSRLGSEGISVQFIVQAGPDHLIFCVDQDERARCLSLVTRSQAGVHEVLDEGPVGVVSIFGPDFRQRPGIAGRMFATLKEAEIAINGISASASNVSCLVYGDQLDDAVAALHAAFELP